MQAAGKPMKAGEIAEASGLGALAGMPQGHRRVIQQRRHLGFDCGAEQVEGGWFGGGREHVVDYLARYVQVLQGPVTLCSRDPLLLRDRFGLYFSDIDYRRLAEGNLATRRPAAGHQHGAAHLPVTQC